MAHPRRCPPPRESAGLSLGRRQPCRLLEDAARLEAAWTRWAAGRMQVFAETDEGEFAEVRLRIAGRRSRQGQVRHTRDPGGIGRHAAARRTGIRRRPHLARPAPSLLRLSGTSVPDPAYV